MSERMRNLRLSCPCCSGLRPVGAGRVCRISAGADDRRCTKHPDVLGAKVRPNDIDRFDLDVTVSSPYDTPERNADAFRVLDQKGAVQGERILLHEMPTDSRPRTTSTALPSLVSGQWCSRRATRPTATAVNASSLSSLGDK